MSASTTIYNSAPFIRTGAQNPTARMNPYEPGMPQVYENFAEQGHPGVATNKIKMFEPFFGVSPGIKDNNESVYQKIFNWQQENYTLPDAYVGQNLYILNILITAIFIADQWPVTRCLPWLKKEDSMEVQWMEWHFTDHMLDRSPEETLPRMLTNTKTSHSKGMQRYGKACSFEDGFLTTPMGRVHWAMSIKQIYNAIVETACFGACVAMIQSSPAIDHLAEFRGSGNNASDTAFIRGVMDQCELMFAPQKRLDGWISLLSRAITEYTNRNGKGPNGFIVPQGTVRYHTHLDHTIANAFKGPTASSDVFRTATSGLEILESREFRIGEHEDNMDPFYKEIVFGGVFVMNDKGSKTVDPSKYKTAMRNTVVYDESIDDHVMIEFTEAMKYSGLWVGLYEEENPILSDVGSAILPTFGSQWKILKWGGQDKWFLNCILSKERVDTFDRFLKFSADCGILTDMESNKHLQSHIDGMKKQPVAKSTGESSGAEVNEENDLLQAKAELNSNILTLLDSTYLNRNGRKVTWGNYIKQLNNGDDHTSTGPTCPIKLHRIDDSQSTLNLDFTQLSRVFNLDKTNKSVSSTITPSKVYGALTTVIIPLEIPIDYLKQLFTIEDQGSSIKSLVNLEIEVDPSLNETQIGFVWLNVMLSIYLSFIESFKYDNYDYATFLNDSFDKISVKRGLTEFNSDNCRTFLNNASHGSSVQYHPETGRINALVDGVVTKFLKSDPVTSKDIPKFQKSAKAVGDISHSEFVTLPFVKNVIEKKNRPEKFTLETIEWVREIMSFSSVPQNKQQQVMNEMVFFYYASRDYECKDDKKPMLYNNVNVLKEYIRVSFSNWIKLRSIYKSSELLQDFFKSLLKEEDTTNLLDRFFIDTSFTKTIKNIKTSMNTKKVHKECGPRLTNFFNILQTKDVYRFLLRLLTINEKLDQYGMPVETRDEIKKFLLNYYLAPSAEHVLINLDSVESDNLSVAEFEQDTEGQKLLGTLFDMFIDVVFNSMGKRQYNRELKYSYLDTEKELVAILENWDPTDGRFVRFCLDHDLPVGFGLNCYRSHMTYLAGTAIIMDLNGAAGNTFFGHANFMVGKDVQKKMTYGNFHMYCAAVVTKPTLVQQIPCVISKRYICGNDTRFWDVNKSEHIDAFTNGDLDIASIAPMIIPANWDTTLPFWDRTGKFGSRANVSRELEEKVDFPFAHIYNEKWNLDGDMSTSLLASIKQPPRCNTRCFRDHQFIYNGATGMFDTWIKNKGPWGERVMPGCGKVRSGYAMHLEIPTYSESKTFTFGL